MKLVIMTPDDMRTEDTVASIHAVTSIGEYIILPEHAPLLLVLMPASTLTYVVGDGAGSPRTCAIGDAGLLKIDRQVTYLIYV